MKKLLHIIASPREEASRTLKVSAAFLDEFKKKHPDCVIDELNLYKEKLPTLTAKTVSGKYMLMSGKELDGELKTAWNDIVKHIERFMSADIYLISTPMWNFSAPYPLKQYIDIILQPRYLFRYTATGPEGLVKGKKMFVITSRGGDYSSDEMKKFDHLEPYLRTAFGLTGLSDITFINAQPMDKGADIQEQKVKEAIQKARAAVI